MENQQKTQVNTQDTRTKVADAIGAFYGAQIAIQKNALDTARAAFESTLALQRTGIQAATRAFESAMVTAPVNEIAARQSLDGFVRALPGMTPEVADRIVNEMMGVLDEVQSTALRTGSVVREAALRGAEQYERLLADVETRSKNGFQTVGSGAESVTLLASRVTGAWVGAFFDATQSAMAATEDVNSVVLKATETGTVPAPQ